MADTDQAYALDYTDGEDFDMNLNMKETRMKPPHPCQLTKEVEPLGLNMIIF